MFWLPIVERELRVAARRPGTYYLRAASGLLAFAVGVVVVYGAWRNPAAAGSVGRDLLMTITSIAYVYALFYGALATADAISQEKREDTIGLLFLTDLKGYDIVLGKLAAYGLNALGGLIAMVPIPALAFLFGGVSAAEYLAAMGLLLVTLLFSTAAGIFSSVLARTVKAGVILGWILVLLPWLAVAIAQPSDTAPPPRLESEVWLMVGSPASALMLTFRVWQNKVTPPGLLGSTLWLTVSYAAMLLAAASWLLPRTWQKRERVEKRVPLLDRVDQFLERKLRLDAWWRRRRAGALASLLTNDPARWLPERLYKLRLKYWALGLMALLLGVFLAARSAHADPEVGLGLMLVSCVGLFVLLKVRVMLQGARAFAESRRNGALATLLTTPLTERDIIRGQMLAFKRETLAPFALNALVHVFLFVMVCANVKQWEVLLGVLTLLLLLLMQLVDLSTLSWMSLWLGLKTANPARAVQRCVVVAFVCQLPTLCGYMAMVVISEREGLPAFGMALGLGLLNLVLNFSVFMSAYGNLKDRFKDLAVG